MSRTPEMMGSHVASAAASVITSAVALATLKESAIKETIQQILALRSGPPTVSPETEKTIARVQAELARSTESWKKMDWRGAKRGNKSGHASASASHSNSSSSNSSSSMPYVRGPSSLAPRGSGPPPKYVSRFKTSEKVDDAILLLIQGKLNKFSQRNYVETHGFLCQILDEGKTHFLKDFMTFVFKKATREELMCPSYVQLLCELASKYTVLLTEMVERYREFSAIFADISEEELSVEDYKALLEANSDKAYRLGYAQFLGELTKYNVLDTSLFVESIGSIVGKIPTIVNATNGKRLLEDYCECLIRILRAIQVEKSPVATSLRAIVKERFLEPLMPYTVKGCCASYKSLSPKGRCMILDITDMVKKF